MKQPKLPPVLSREDFDSDEEYKYYHFAESEEHGPVPEDIDEVRNKWKGRARETISGKRERITLAIPVRNLSRIRSIALKRGIPYQTLINEHLNELAKQSTEPPQSK